MTTHQYYQMDDSPFPSDGTDAEGTGGPYNPFEFKPPGVEEVATCIDSLSEAFVPISNANYAVTFDYAGETHLMQMNGAALVALQSIAPGCPFTAVQM